MKPPVLLRGNETLGYEVEKMLLNSDGRIGISKGCQRRWRTKDV
jgi:hypothetical protein